MQQFINNSLAGRFNTEEHTPSWYRPSLQRQKDDRPFHKPAKRVFIGSGEDVALDEPELNNLMQEEVCTL